MTGHAPGSPLLCTIRAPVRTGSTILTFSPPNLRLFPHRAFARICLSPAAPVCKFSKGPWSNGQAWSPIPLALARPMLLRSVMDGPAVLPCLGILGSKISTTADMREALVPRGWGDDQRPSWKIRPRPRTKTRTRTRSTCYRVHSSSRISGRCDCARS